MYNDDIQESIIKIAIDQLIILKNAADGKKGPIVKSKDCLRKEKVLLVEGKSDTRFWERIFPSDVFINDVKDFTDSICALLNKRANNKTAVLQVCRAINTMGEDNSPHQSILESWDVNGIIDRDFDDRNNDNIKGIYITDTHDLETMLIYTDSEIFKRLNIAKSYGLIITNEQANAAKHLSLQMGWFRMAWKNLPRNELNWIYCKNTYNDKYSKRDSIDYGLLIDSDGDFDIMQYLREINKLKYYNDQKDYDYLVSIRDHLTATNILRDKVSKDGKWYKSGLNDDLDIWKTINGHDYLKFLRCIVPGAMKAYKSDY